MKYKILLADDDASLRRVIQFKLNEHGYDVVAVGDGQEALEKVRSDSFDLLLSDVRMPKLDGLDLLEAARKIKPDLQVILITAVADITLAVQAVKLGAFDYLTKPFDDDRLFLSIEKALKLQKLQQENRKLRKQLDHVETESGMIGVSIPFKEMLSMAARIAPSDATVLITGESGTGKEVVARFIHRQSERSEGPFVAVNCAAIPRDLIESELFGYIKGAFTGAVKDKRGRFEMASGGTLLLDEIGELPIELQAKLLRAIQEKQVEQLGAEHPTEVDIRLIACTNIDLEQSVHDGKFRQDLFYRLNVIPLRVPSLSERTDDIPMLVQTFTKRFAKEIVIEVDDSLMQPLLEYHWPGNIRELENLIERIVILRRSDRLTSGDLPVEFGRVKPSIATDTADNAHDELSFYDAEKKLILSALNRHHWNRSKAARYLKIPRHVLIYRMKKYELAGQEPTTEH